VRPICEAGTCRSKRMKNAASAVGILAADGEEDVKSINVHIPIPPLLERRAGSTRSVQAGHHQVALSARERLLCAGARQDLRRRFSWAGIL
jgi:hypothetical protein